MNRNTILVLAVVALLVIYLTKQAKSVASSAVNAKAGAVNSVITGGFGLATSLLDVLAGRHSSGRTVMVQISIGPLITEAGIFGLAIVRRAGASDGG